MFGVAVKWIFGVLTLMVLIYLIFGPEQLFSGVRNVLIYFGLGKLPGERTPEFQGTLVPQEVETYFDNLVSIFENPPPGDNCLVKLKEKVETENFQITLNTGNIKIESREDKGFTPVYETEKIEGFKPCIVNVENFYGNYLEGKNKVTLNLGNTDKFSEASLVIAENEIKYNAESYSFDQNYLFKTNGHVCFFLTHDTGVTWYKPWEIITKYGCDASQYTLDNDCMQTILDKKILKIC